ncbi:MAG: ArsR/SmtB family transcription factor [Thermoplasmata archaeon]
MAVRSRAPLSDLDVEGFELEADLIRVLANPKRLMIVDLLGAGPSTVTEIAAWLSLSLQNTSQQLRVMKDRGIVRARRDGREVRYALTNPVISESCRLVRQGLLADPPRRLPRVRWEARPAPSVRGRRAAEPARVRRPIPAPG